MSAFDPIAASALADRLDLITPDPLPIAEPTGFYADMQRVAAEMLLTFMTGVVILQFDATADRSSVDDPLAAPTIIRDEVAVSAYVGGYSAEQVDGERIQSADLRIIADAKGLPSRPVQGQTIKVDGAYLTLQRVKPIPAAGPVTSLYILQARAVVD